MTTTNTTDKDQEQTMTKIARVTLGKLMPAGSEFVTVGDLFDLPPEERTDVEVLIASPWHAPLRKGGHWMCVERLLEHHRDSSASLRDCPSGMVVVARRIGETS